MFVMSCHEEQCFNKPTKKCTGHVMGTNEKSTSEKENDDKERKIVSFV
jgi:hypothetical protein